MTRLRIADDRVVWSPDDFGLLSTKQEKGGWLPVQAWGRGYPVGVGPLYQTVWHINRQTGDDSRDGLTPATAVLTAAEIKRRWLDWRPPHSERVILPPNLTITVTWDSGAVAQPDTVDPASVLLDVDMSRGTTLILQGASSTLSHSGTLTSVSSFARTSAQGQIAITDAGTADFSPFVQSLLTDVNTTAVAWLYEPHSASGTGLITPPRAPLAVGSTSMPASASMTAGDAYTLSSLVPIYMGSPSATRTVGFDVFSAGTARIFIFNLWLQSANTNELWLPNNESTSLDSGSIFVQQCRVDPGIQITKGSILFANCLCTSPNPFGRQGVLGSGASLTIYAGASYRGFSASGGAVLEVDGDFVLDGTQTIFCNNQGNVFVGNMSHWGTSSNGALAIDVSGRIIVQRIFDSVGPVVYGTVGASNPIMSMTTDTVAGAIFYPATQTAQSTFNFDSATTHWTMPFSGTQSWGFNPATGRYGGNGDGTPTSNTLAHLDAAINAPGFGNCAIDPQSLCTIRQL